MTIGTQCATRGTSTVIATNSVSTGTSTSSIIGRALIDVCIINSNMPFRLFVTQQYSPLHVASSESSSYPVLHEHIKLPTVFVQTWLHPPLLVLHSLTSVCTINNSMTIIIYDSLTITTVIKRRQSVSSATCTIVATNSVMTGL